MNLLNFNIKIINFFNTQTPHRKPTCNGKQNHPVNNMVLGIRPDEMFENTRFIEISVIERYPSVKNCTPRVTSHRSSP